MTNILIGYPDILRDAVSVIDSASPSADISNIISGDRRLLFELESAAATAQIKISLGAEASANYLYIARADFLANDADTISLKGCATDDYGSATEVYANALFSSETFIGAAAEDFIATFNAASFKYWWVDFAKTSGTGLFRFSKLYLGSWLDFGREPIFDVDIDGSTPAAQVRRRAYKFKLTWVGLPNDKITEALSNALTYNAINPVVIYDAAKIIVPGVSCYFARISDFEITKTTNLENELIISFEELI